MAIAIDGIPYFCLPLNERPKAHYQRPKVLKVDLGPVQKIYFRGGHTKCIAQLALPPRTNFGLRFDLEREWIYEIFEECIESQKREYTCERKICLQIKKHTHDVLYLSSNSVTYLSSLLQSFFECYDSWSLLPNTLL